QTFLGKKYFYSYNNDLENISIDLMKGNQMVRIFNKTPFVKNGEYLIPEYKLSLQDKSFDVTLDLFGNPLMMKEDFQGRERVVFNNKVVDDMVLESTSPFYIKGSRPSRLYLKYNARGELLSKKYESLTSNLMQMNRYID